MPVGRDARRHHITLLCRARRWLEQFAKGTGAVLAVEGAPGINRSGHGHRMRRLHGNLADPAIDIPVDGGFRRGPSGAVQGNRQCTLARIEDKAVAPDAGALRLDNTLHRDRRDRGIGGVAAGA